MSNSSFQQVSDEAVVPFNGAETSHQTDPDNQELHNKMWEWAGIVGKSIFQSPTLLIPTLELLGEFQ